MWRMVSSEEPSKVFWMPSAWLEKRDSSGQTSSTWSRKQWPVPSSSMVSFLRSSLGICLRRVQAWPRGIATMNGSSYTGCSTRPKSGSGSAMTATSISPFFSSSTSRTVKFSLSSSGICGALRSSWRTSAGSR